MATIALILAMQSKRIAKVDYYHSIHHNSSSQTPPTIVLEVDPKCDNKTVQIWFVTVMALAWLGTSTLSVCYLMKFNKLKKTINWQMIEFAHSFVFAFLCFVAAVVEANQFPDCSIYAVASTFAFALFFGFSVSAFSAMRRVLSK